MIANAIPKEAAHRSAVQRPNVNPPCRGCQNHLSVRGGVRSPCTGRALRRIMQGDMATDHMPLDGWDHVELWVGNAKQAAYWYEHALGFERAAYAGPETGVRDRASYVLRQGEIRFVLT